MDDASGRASEAMNDTTVDPHGGGGRVRPDVSATAAPVRHCQIPVPHMAPADAAPILVVLHQERSIPGRIGHWLTSRGYRLDIRRPALGQPLPNTLSAHAGAIIYGGPMSANDPDDFIKQEIDFCGLALREERPFLGVCLGAQMLAKQLGARVSPHPDGDVEVGYYPIELTDAGHNLDLPFPSHFYQWHREGFELPSGAELMATTETYENQMMRVGQHAYGLQFHAEITYHLINRWTIGASQRLELPNARPREAHFHDHIRYTSAVGDWLDAFLPGWLGAKVDARP